MEEWSAVLPGQLLYVYAKYHESIHDAQQLPLSTVFIPTVSFQWILLKQLKFWVLKSGQKQSHAEIKLLLELEPAEQST